jgi:hypothetical protein
LRFDLRHDKVQVDLFGLRWCFMEKNLVPGQALINYVAEKKRQTYRADVYAPGLNTSGLRLA